MMPALPSELPQSCVHISLPFVSEPKSTCAEGLLTLVQQGYATVCVFCVCPVADTERV